MYLLFLMYINALGFSHKEMFLENIVILMEVLVKEGLAKTGLVDLV